MKKFKVIYALLFLVTLVFSGCSKDEAADDSDSSLSITTQDLSAKIPTNLDDKSPETSLKIQNMIAMMAITEGFTNSKPAAKTTGKTVKDVGQTWVYDGYTITYTENTSETQYLFSYTMKQNNTTFYTINGWINKNGSAGHWDLFIKAGVAQSTDNTTVDFDWTKNSSNDYNLDMVVNFGGYFTSKLVANIYNNGSGNLSSYFDGELEFKSTWNANGSGSYIDYTETPPTTTNY
jgi:hypothetical protein